MGRLGGRRLTRVYSVPCAGLDAHASLELLRTLSVIAKGGRLVMLSIHQPRLEIYHMFDSILFLCAGRVSFDWRGEDER